MGYARARERAGRNFASRGWRVARRGSSLHGEPRPCDPCTTKAKSTEEKYSHGHCDTRSVRLGTRTAGVRPFARDPRVPAPAQLGQPAHLQVRGAALERDVEEINDLGGISRQYLNHHEASPACDWVAKTFDAPLHVHEEDAGAVAQICNVDATFSGRHKLDEDFEVIPIPGHTSGATASSGIRGSIASCSPATRSSLVGANGGLRYSTGSATGSDTSRAWS